MTHDELKAQARANVIQRLERLSSGLPADELSEAEIELLVHMEFVALKDQTEPE